MRLARASPRALLVNVTLLQLYWLTGVAQFSSSPLEVAHATLGIVLTVYVLGHSFRTGFVGNFRFATVASVGRVAIDVILSVITFTVTVCMLSFFFLLTTVHLGLAIGAIIIASNLLEMTRPPVKEHNGPLRISWIAYPAVIITFGLLVAFIFRYSFAWPSMPGWDTYVHLAETSLIQARHGSSELFPIASGTVLPYPLVFHAQMASFSDILGINAYTIFWLAPFYLIPIYGLLVYGLASVLTKDRMQSLFAGMLGASIGGGEILLGPQYLFPSTLFILIFLLSLIAFIESPLKGVSQIVLGFALFAVTFALYYYPLFLATVPIVAFLIDHGANSRFAQWRKPALLG